MLAVSRDRKVIEALKSDFRYIVVATVDCARKAIFQTDHLPSAETARTVNADQDSTLYDQFEQTIID